MARSCHVLPWAVVLVRSIGRSWNRSSADSSPDRFFFAPSRSTADKSGATFRRFLSNRRVFTLIDRCGAVAHLYVWVCMRFRTAHADDFKIFCSDCGARVFTSNLESFPGMILVTLGSLDNPQSIKPTLEMFTKRRLAWVKPLDLPQFENMPS